MIDPKRIERVRELLAEGQSHRAVAKQVGVSRATVSKLAAGNRPDYPPKQDIDPRDTLMPGEQRVFDRRRCSLCGGLLRVIPCRRCKTVFLLKAAGLQVVEDEGPDGPLRLELKPEDHQRYLQVHADRVMAEREAGTIGAQLYTRP